MITNRDTAFAFTLSAEGALSLDPGDGGNYASGTPYDGPLIGSKLGVSARALAAYLDPEPVTADIMAALTQATAEAIWTPEYWARLDCDSLAWGIDLLTCDHGYNRGAYASARVLQRLCGADVDGWIGSKTVTIANWWATTPRSIKGSSDAVRCVQHRLGVRADGVVGPATVQALGASGFGATIAALVLLADAQLADYRTLPTFGRYGRGWTARVWDRLGAGLALIHT